MLMGLQALCKDRKACIRITRLGVLIKIIKFIKFIKNIYILVKFI